MFLSRRTFMWLTPALAMVPRAAAGQSPSVAPGGKPLSPNFPSQDADLAREMVTVSHGNAARVRELLENWPTLANASWDWGYGDWESALGAASHVGNREIAGLLIAAGARPTIFSAAMLGQLDVVKAFVSAAPGIQKTRGPHGITLLSHARAGGAGAAGVVAYLENIGDADPRYSNEPLADTDRAAIVGTYAFGPAATEQLIVKTTDRGLSIERAGKAARGLLHLGQRAFHPVGAHKVRIRFAPGNPSAGMTIEDGPVLVTATRMA